MPTTLALTIKDTQGSMRLDRALAESAAESPDVSLSRVRLQALIRQGHVTKDGKGNLEPDQKVRAGEVYVVVLPAPEPAKPKAQKIPLHILYEDDDVLVLDKPPGLVVHPAAGNRDKTLVNALLAHCGKSLSGIGGVARPGIVHRLDKDTGGLMVVAKNDAAHHALSRQFADRSLSRVYHALVWGVPTPAVGSIEGAIGRHPTNRQKMAVVGRGGKPALTHYKVLKVFAGGLASLVACTLSTGRTHQIRVHMAHKKHPLVGDQTYGHRTKGPNHPVLKSFPRQALHAVELSFLHPRTNRVRKFTTKLPEDMAALFFDF